MVCRNFDISRDIRPGESGQAMRPEGINRLMLPLQGAGCRNIDLVTPGHAVPQVVEARAPAMEGGRRLPIVHSTGAYDPLESPEWMHGVADIHMPDFKPWSAGADGTCLRAEDNPGHARAAIREMHRQVGPLTPGADGPAARGLIIRHPVMPGMPEGTRSILGWIAREPGPAACVDLMDRYYPAGGVSTSHCGEIGRRPDGSGFAPARTRARESGPTGLDGRRPSP